MYVLYIYIYIHKGVHVSGWNSKLLGLTLVAPLYDLISPLKDTQIAIEIVDFPIENGDFPIENGDFP